MTKKPKLTPWIDGSIKPSIPGVYEREFFPGEYYCLWTGSFWDMPSSNLLIAAIPAHRSSIQSRPWRGLAEKP